MVVAAIGKQILGPTDGSVASALVPWSAEMLASKLRCDKDIGGKIQQGICYLGASVVSNPSTVENRTASALASVLPKTVTSRAGGDCVQKAAIFKSTSKKVSTVDCRANAVRGLTSALERRPESRRARRLLLWRTRRRGVILAAMLRECWSTIVLSSVGCDVNPVYSHLVSCPMVVRTVLARGAIAGASALLSL